MPYPGSSTYPGSTTYPGTDGPVTTTSSLRLGIGRSFVRTAGTGGGGVTPGPTVQLAGVTTPLSLVHGTTGTFTATPEDSNAVATGAQPYWHSSDASVVRIDNAATGAYTVTGVATNTVTITVDFIAPAVAFAPTEYNAGTDTLIFDVNFGDYASATAMGALGVSNDTSSTYMAPNPSPRFSGTAVDTTSAVITASTRPGAAGGEKMYQNRYTGTSSFAPQLRGFIKVADYPDAARTRYHSWYAQINFADAFTGANVPLLNVLRVKWFEEYLLARRNQFSIDDSAPNAGSGFANSAWECPGQAFADPRTTQSFQQVSPYPGEVILDRSWHRYRYAARSHTAAPGTATFEIMTCNATLEDVGSGVVHVGERIVLKAVQVPGVPVTSAEFEIMTLNDSGAHPYVTLQRRDDVLGATDVGNIFFTDTTWRVRFSVSQSGHISVGDFLATTYTDPAGWEVTSIIDGQTMLVDRNATDNQAYVYQEFASVPFARSSDGFTGFSRMWVDNTLVINQCAAAVGDPTVPTTLKQVAQLPVAQPLTMINIGDNQSGGDGPTFSGPGSVRATMPWDMNIVHVQTFTRSEP